MKQFFTLLVLFLTLNIYSQTVIEMRYIEDADVVLTEVDNIDSADIVIYRAENIACAKYWDNMWYFRNWGFSNFSIYIIKDSTNISIADTTEMIKPNCGNVYFTTDYHLRGIKSKNFHLNGVMIVNKKKKTTSK